MRRQITLIILIIIINYLLNFAWYLFAMHEGTGLGSLRIDALVYYYDI